MPLLVTPHASWSVANGVSDLPRVLPHEPQIALGGDSSMMQRRGAACAHSFRFWGNNRWGCGELELVSAAIHVHGHLGRQRFLIEHYPSLCPSQGPTAVRVAICIPKYMYIHQEKIFRNHILIQLKFTL